MLITPLEKLRLASALQNKRGKPRQRTRVNWVIADRTSCFSIYSALVFFADIGTRSVRNFCGIKTETNYWVIFYFIFFLPFHLTHRTPIWEKKNASQSGDDWLNLSPSGLAIPLLQSRFGGSGDGGSFVFAFWVAVYTNQMGETHGGRRETRMSHFHFFCQQIKPRTGLLRRFTDKLQSGWLSWRL